jgi:predicted naringenin-chalcone synthase
MFITGLGTAAPEQRYTQAQCWDALQNSARFRELTPRSRAILRKVLTGSNGIATRHLSLDKLTDAFDMTPDALHERFTHNAPLLATQAAERVLSVSVEVCSAAMYLDDDVGVLISACLFGDGAGAAVLSNAPGENRKVEWKTSGSLLQPNQRDLLRFEQKSGMLRNILTPEVPALAAQHAGKLFIDTIARANVNRSEVSGWVLHPGGRDVLIALRDTLGLTDRDIRWSEAVLREYGNVSSSSVYFVLQHALNDSVPAGLWWMSSFGAGFSCHGALLEVG